MVGGGKNGFSLDSFLKAFEHKDHEDEVGQAFSCVSAGGVLDVAKCKKIMESWMW